MGLDIIVCVKRVPETADAEVSIDDTGKDIKRDDLVYAINEWDNYAVQEAVNLKEQYGGSITVVTVGDEESDEVLRRSLAMGADEAIRITDPALEGADGYAVATVLSKALKDQPYSLVLTGVQAADDGYGMVGLALAEQLGTQHAALVNKIESVDETKAKLHRELEGGLEEVIEVGFPAVLTIQSGINEPKYVSIMGIRKVASKEIKTYSLSDLGLSVEDVESLTTVENAALPQVGEGAEMLEGSPDEVNDKILELVKEKGGK